MRTVLPAMFVLFFLPLVDEGSIFARCDNFLATSPPFRAAFRVTSSSRPNAGTGEIAIDRGRRMAFRLKWNDIDYRLFENPSFGLELDDSAHTYLDLGPRSNGLIPHSMLVEEAADGFPLLLVLPRGMRSFLQEKVTLKSLGKKSIRGVQAEGTLATYSAGTIEVFADSIGRPLSLRMTQKTEAGPSDVTFEFSGFTSTLPANTFSATVPPSYNAHGVPVQPDPHPVGAPLPLGLWRSGDGSLVNLDSKLDGHSSLIAYVETDSEPATNLLRSNLAALGKEAGIPLVVLVGGPSPAAFGPNAYSLPASEAATRLLAPGSPLIYLRGADGHVQWIGFGYREDDGPAMLTELKGAISGRSEKGAGH